MSEKSVVTFFILTVILVAVALFSDFAHAIEAQSPDLNSQLKLAISSSQEESVDINRTLNKIGNRMDNMMDKNEEAPIIQQRTFIADTEEFDFTDIIYNQASN